MTRDAKQIASDAEEAAIHARAALDSPGVVAKRGARPAKRTRRLRRVRFRPGTRGRQSEEASVEDA